jgi:UDP-GlcNAc3NAcA epimerase
MKIVTVIGARPQFIKAAPVSRAVRRSASISEVIVHTGQHYDQNMSGVFFQELDLPRPAYELGIGSATHGAQTGRMMEAIEEVLLQELPGWVLVYGDTNSTLAAALAGVKLHIRVAHVEAGLRSFNRRMPEEINRILTDHAADVLFAPTPAACRNLEKEGLGSKIIRSGDVMLDAALFSAEHTRDTVRQKLGLSAKSYCLATIHRAENTDNPASLRKLIGALRELSRTLPVVFPLHPRTASRLSNSSIPIDSTDSFTVIDPIGYLDMIDLEKNAALIATDSGGMQKEAYFFSVPCVTMRSETEWVELVEHGFNVLADPDAHSLARVFQNALQSTPDWSIKLYGDGDAAAQIIHELENRCQENG